MTRVDKSIKRILTRKDARGTSVYAHATASLASQYSLWNTSPLEQAPAMVLLKWQTASKDCLDKAIKNGVDHSVLTVCGLLCESGYQKGGNEIVTQDSHAVLLTIDSQYKAFAIDLKYHVMYRLIEIGTFYLPRDYNNLDIMLGAF